MAGLVNVGEMGALALHIMVELTLLRERDGEGRLTVQELAAALDASPNTLAKVARRLVVLGMADGTRGVNGGLRLAGDPDSVNMLMVVEGVEGRVCSNGCLFSKRVCPPGRCIFHGLTDVIERSVREHFVRTSLSDLAEMARR